MGSAALAKSIDINKFSTYLELPFNRFRYYVAISIVGFEWILCLGLVLSTFHAQLAPYALRVAACFLLIATSYLAYRLLMNDNTQCNCWGKINVSIGKEETVKNIVLPVLDGFRNSIIMVVVYSTYKLTMHQGLYIDSELFMVFLICPLVIAVGLLSSIYWQYSLLHVAEHPRKQELAPSLRPLLVLDWYRKDVISANSLWESRILEFHSVSNESKA